MPVVISIPLASIERLLARPRDIQENRFPGARQRDPGAGSKPLWCRLAQSDSQRFPFWKLTDLGAQRESGEGHLGAVRLVGILDLDRTDHSVPSRVL